MLQWQWGVGPGGRVAPGQGSAQGAMGSMKPCTAQSLRDPRPEQRWPLEAEASGFQPRDLGSGGYWVTCRAQQWAACCGAQQEVRLPQGVSLFLRIQGNRSGDLVETPTCSTMSPLTVWLGVLLLQEGL